MTRGLTREQRILIERVRMADPPTAKWAEYVRVEATAFVRLAGSEAER